MNGKVMLELFRMVQYGTKMSDLEIRPMFRQGVKAVDDIFTLSRK